MRSTKTLWGICLFLLPMLLLSCEKATDPKPDPLGTSWKLMETWSVNNVNSIAKGDTLCVAVGAGGVVRSSPDGLRWTQQAQSLTYSLSDVCWTGAEFVAVGSNGLIATSSEGVTWTGRKTPAEGLLTSVAGNGTHIIAAGHSGNLVSTTNGADWIEHSSGIPIVFEDILFADTLWLACGDSGMTAWSSDGLAWTRRAAPLPEDCRLVSLTETGAGFYAVGVRESFVGTNRSFVYSSAEGLDWNLTASFDDIVLRDIAWTGSNLVAVGGRSIDHGNAPLSAVMTSPDGVTWQEQPSDAPKELYSVVTGPGFIAAAGSGGYMITGSSTDNLSIDRSGATIKSVVYDGSGFVGVTNFGTVVTSTTGSNWEERHSLAATYFSGLAYSSDKYVALGGYNGEARSIYFSSDGTSWIQVWEPVAGEIFDLIRGGGQFVGVGEYGHVFLSDDGQNWDRVAAAGSIDLRTVAWSGSKYLALGDSTAHKSSDGTTWTNRRINVPDGSVIKQVTWAEGQFRGVGYRIPDSADGYYCFFSSADGYTWTTRKLKNDLIAPSDLVWTGARYMIFGRFGTLMTSANGEEWDILEAGTEAEFSGMAVSSRRLLVTGADRTVIRAER